MKSFSFFSFDHMLILLLLLLSLWFSFSQPLCHDDERSSLLQFKQSLAVQKFASRYPLAYPKAASWTGEGAIGDCCQWDGVECDSEAGHVIGLDLSSSLLYGSIDSNNSLFSLVHLETLNLFDNHFNYSQIPSSIKQLSKLSYLNLSSDVFSGQVPPEISELSSLSTLDLSLNANLSSEKGLSLIQNMTRLEELYLISVNLSSAFPTFLANFSSLTSLNLAGCGLRGNIHVEIFQLPNLRNLELESNHLTGELPPFNKNNSLQVLAVAENDISGELPASIGELSSLIVLDVQHCNLSGAIPVSIGKLNQLEFLSFSDNNFRGLIPSFLENLTQITDLELGGNHFSGQIPSLFSKLKNLDSLNLEDNDLSGTVNFDMFLSLKNLTRLSLSYNTLSVLIEPGHNETLPQFTILKLAFCTLSSFPYFLRHQTRMENLSLRRTHIGGLIPQWFMNMSRTTLYGLNLAENFFIGEVSANICNLKFLSILQLYRNKLFGKLPSCLGNFTNSLMMLNLRGNSFSGNLPEFGEGSQLGIIDLSDNRLEGKLPRSLKNCKALGDLVLGRNRITDVFPYWLGKISELRVLVLGSNRFHGVIEEPQSDFDFPQLRIIDISENAFTGKLPSKYIQNWKAMKRGSVGDLSYMSTTYRQFFPSSGATMSYSYAFKVMITIKGVKRYYDVINEDLAVIDFSHNYFDGEIPEVIGDLKALHAIDLSSNNLSGGIPPSLGNLSELESLDLSQNMLSGEIPQELTNLNFLQYFNVSHNRLTGPIPQAKQLSTFDASSYEGNLGLCGIPLPDKCGNSNASSHSNALEDKQEDNSFGFGWKVVAIGYACGFLAGMFIGNFVITRRPRWFAMVFWVRIVRATRKRSVGRGN